MGRDLTQALYVAAVALGRTRDAQEVVRVTIAETRRAAGIEAVALHLLDSSREVLILREYAGATPALWKQMATLPLSQACLAATAIREQRAVACAVGLHPTPPLGALYARQGFRYVTVVPVAGREQVLGVLHLASREEAPPDPGGDDAGPGHQRPGRSGPGECGPPGAPHGPAGSPAGPGRWDPAGPRGGGPPDRPRAPRRGGATAGLGAHRPGRLGPASAGTRGDVPGPPWSFGPGGGAAPPAVPRSPAHDPGRPRPGFGHPGQRRSGEGERVTADASVAALLRQKEAQFTAQPLEVDDKLVTAAAGRYAEHFGNAVLKALQK